jgi:hypothetical protein
VPLRTLLRPRWQRFGRSGGKLIWGGEAVAVSHEGRANPNQLLASPRTQNALAHLRTVLVREHILRTGSDDGLVMGLQLTHSGRYCRPNEHTRPEPRILYHHPWLDRRLKLPADYPLLTDGEIEAIIQDFHRGLIWLRNWVLISLTSSIAMDAERMNRPPLEVADIVRCAGQSFIERSRKWISWQHQKVLLAISRCRTAALGGHRDQCSDCGHSAISYNSCRNRHCPKCQGNARLRWLQARERELLPASYVHVVFTLPRELAPLALQNKRLIYNLLFHASAATLLEIARDPRHLGAEIGFFSVLHTWDQRLQHHPHVHCVLASGGLAPDHSRWISSPRSFFLPVKVLGRIFRGKFVAGLKNAFHAGALQFHGHLLPLAEPRAFASWLRVLFRHDWVVYSKRPFGGPEHVLRYLGAYTHRVAISNSRLVALSEGNVTFRWRDSAHGNKKRLMTLSVEEFLRRFLLHLLPRGFMRIRNFGFLANRRRAELLPLCFRLLQPSDQPTVCAASLTTLHAHSTWNCPLCGGTMRVVERLSTAQLLLRSPPPLSRCAS